MCPDLVDTSLGRRDVRAVIGPVVPSKFTDAAGNPIYSSGLSVDSGTQTFEYTVEFNSLVSDAKDMASIVARCDGFRILTWEVTETGVFAQGLTISGKARRMHATGSWHMGAPPVLRAPWHAPPPAGPTMHTWYRRMAQSR